MTGSARELLLGAFETAIARLHPGRLVEEALRRRPPDSETVVVAIGKSVIPMAEGVAAVAGEAVSRGLVVAPESACDERSGTRPHPTPLPPGAGEGAKWPPSWRFLLGNHPVPGPLSFEAGRELVRFCGEEPERPLLALVSGGGSALAERPRPPLTEEDFVRIGDEILRRGLPIGEMNAIRRSLSAIKGGGLAALRSGLIRTLVLSDVGSDPAVVASGPTLPPPGNPAEDVVVLERFLAEPGFPSDLVHRARDAARGRNPRFRAAEAELLAGPADLARAFATACEEEGLATRIREENFEGTVEEVAERIGTDVRAAFGDAAVRPLVLVRAGEPTLRVPAAAPPGGRASHLALLVTRRIGPIPAGIELTILSAGSDGVDGTGGGAGALVTDDLFRAWQPRGDEIDRLLESRSSLAWLEREGALLTARPTGVNLRDVVAVALGPAGGFRPSDGRASRK